MSARSIGSGTIKLALLAIPVKFFTATSEKAVSFNMLHEPPCGARVKQEITCPAHAGARVALERGDTVKGYEYSRDKYVIFSGDELKAIEDLGSPGAIEVDQIVPAKSVDFVSISKSVFLGPDKGAARAYHLLAMSLENARAVAVGRLGQRGRDAIAVVRPYAGGLALHHAHFADEVRAFDELEVGDRPTFGADERRLARELLEQLGGEAFDPGRLTDTYEARVLAAVERKIAGKEVVVPPAPATPGEELELVEALRRSVERKTPSGQRAKRGRAA